MYVYTYVYTYVYIPMYIYLYIYIRIHTHTHTHTHTQKFANEPSAATSATIKRTTSSTIFFMWCRIALSNASCVSICTFVRQ